MPPPHAAMFEHYGVNSLSAFRERFCSGSRASGSSSSTSCNSSRNSRPSWRLHRQEGEVFVGSTLNGMRQGMGLLLTQTPRSAVLYAGHFGEGARSGYGTVQTSRGEAFAGYWSEDAMWGPGQYWFAPPPAIQPAAAAGGGGGGGDCARVGGEAGTPAPATAPLPPPPAPPPHRVCHVGMFRGSPDGLGLLTWSDGSRQAGRFRGTERWQALGEGEVRGVAAVAAENAERAQEAAAEAWGALVAQPELHAEVVALCGQRGLQVLAARGGEAYAGDA